MKFDDNVQKHIDEYFNNISGEDFARLLSDKYHVALSDVVSDDIEGEKIINTIENFSLDSFSVADDISYSEVISEIIDNCGERDVTDKLDVQSDMTPAEAA